MKHWCKLGKILLKGLFILKKIITQIFIVTIDSIISGRHSSIYTAYGICFTLLAIFLFRFNSTLAIILKLLAVAILILR